MPAEKLIEDMALEMEAAEFGYSLRLTRLVDGVSTYTLTFSDSDEVLEFEDTEEAYALIATRKREAQARAAYAVAFPAIREMCAATRESVIAGLELLRRAVIEEDPKRELLVRINDLATELAQARALSLDALPAPATEKTLVEEVAELRQAWKDLGCVAPDAPAPATGGGEMVMVPRTLIEQLRANVRVFGGHRPHCKWNFGGECSCGWLEAAADASAASSKEAP